MVLVEGGKLENPEKNPWNRDKKREPFFFKFLLIAGKLSQ